MSELPEKIAVSLPGGRTVTLYVDLNPTVPYLRADGSLHAQILVDDCELKQALREIALQEMSEEEKANPIPDIELYDALSEHEQKLVQRRVNQFDRDRADIRRVLGLPKEEIYRLRMDEDEGKLFDPFEDVP
jgi:hypothetical protein